MIKVTDNTIIYDLIEQNAKILFNGKRNSEQFISDYIEREIFTFTKYDIKNISDLKSALSRFDAYKIQNDKFYQLKAINELEDLLYSITSLKTPYLSDFVFDLFIEKYFRVIDFDSDSESTVWERFWYCMGDIGSSNQFTSAIDLFDIYFDKFNSSESYIHFTFSYFYALLKITYMIKNDEEKNSNLDRIHALLSKISEDKRFKLEFIYGNITSQYESPFVDDDQKKFLEFILTNFRRIINTD